MAMLGMWMLLRGGQTNRPLWHSTVVEAVIRITRAAQTSVHGHIGAPIPIEPLQYAGDDVSYGGVAVEY